MSGYIQTFATWAGAAAFAYGGFQIFQGATSMASNRRMGRPSDSSEWWQIVEGGLWAALGASGLVYSIISTITA